MQLRAKSMTITVRRSVAQCVMSVLVMNSCNSSRRTFRRMGPFAESRSRWLSVATPSSRLESLGLATVGSEFFRIAVALVVSWC
jgi:hypothetical protein